MYDDHNAEVKIAGRSHPVNHHDPRQAALQLVSEQAAQLGRPVKATAVEADGTSWPLVIHPDGEVEAIEIARKKKPIWPIVVAFSLAGVLIAGTTLWLTVLRPKGPPPPPKASPTLPALPPPSIAPDQFSARPVPPGWTPKASWTVDIAANSQPAVSPDGSEVAVLTQDKKIAVFDTEGKVKWQDKVPSGVDAPVYTTIDGKPVLAVANDDTLYYWAGNGAEAVEVALPNSSTVQFFGTSPLVLLASNAGASVVSGGELKPVPNQPRLSTMLLAEGQKTLMARYEGPLYWSEPGQPLQTLELKPPKGVKDVERIVAASPDRVLVFWKAAGQDMVVPAVHSSADGSPKATCAAANVNDSQNWQWLPDASRKVAAWGECLINFSTGKTSLYPNFRPLSVTGTTIYGSVNSKLVTVTPGGKSRTIPTDTARPWGVAGPHAIVVHDDVVYALDKP
nr:hypothetical protein [Kribbella sandramycini]